MDKVDREITKVCVYVQYFMSQVTWLNQYSSRVCYFKFFTFSCQVESEINRLQKKKTQLEESAKKPPEPEKAESSPQRVEPKHRDLWQIIYAENKVSNIETSSPNWINNC